MKNCKLLTFLAVVTGLVAFAAGPAMADLAAGVTLDFNANDPLSGVSDSNWNSLTADNSSDWVFGADVSLKSVSDSTSITKAYLFTGGDGAQTSSYNKYAGPDFFTIEVWLKPSDTGADSQVVFETGAGFRGMAVWYSKGTDSDGTGTINFTVDDGSNYDTVSAEIDTTKFTQVTGVYSRNIDAAGTDLLEIFIDGAFVAENREHTGINNWGGGNAAGLASTLTAACNDVPSDSGGFDGYISIFRFWEGKALTEAEVSGNYGDFAGGYITVIYPENGAVVPPGDVTLLWENYDDPCTPETDAVSVDVRWGTDPNRYNDNYTQVASGEVVTTATISPAGPGVYYWYVDTNITLASGDPCTLEGRVYKFTNDGPIASVDTGPDMITWVGEPVTMVADVNDDGGSTLSYSWTASEAPGVTTTFTDATASNPDVTFTRGTYEIPYAENASFEVPELSDGSDTAIGGTPGNLPPWKSAWKQTTATDWNFHTWRGGAYNPTVDEYTAIPDGENVGWVTASSNPDYEHCVYAQTRLTIEAGKTYELSAMAGSRLTNLSTNDYRIEIVGSGIAANSGSQPSPAAGDWVNTTISYTPTASDPNIGEPLTIRLVSEGGSSTTGPDFDSVVLKVDGFDSSVEYDLVSSITVTAAVQDETNPAVSDSMIIDIYEDACEAALEGFGLGADHPTDFNKNCITGLEDLAAIASAWLNDTSATGPMQK